MSSQVNFNGNFYYARAATDMGESPETHPAKWQPLLLPAELRNAIALRAAAGLQEESKPEIAMALRGNAEAELTRRKHDAALRDGQARQMAVRN